MARIILVLGGARSGKSDFALNKAAALSGSRVFLATAEARDDEMLARIERHRQQRGSTWRTVEEPLTIASVLEREADSVVVVDCLTLWLANVQSRVADTESAIAELLSALGRCACPVVLVSNEVGCGIVPANALAREFRDYAGLLNQRVAQLADEVYLMIAGQAICAKTSP